MALQISLIRKGFADPLIWFLVHDHVEQVGFLYRKITETSRSVRMRELFDMLAYIVFQPLKQTNKQTNKQTKT